MVGRQSLVLVSAGLFALCVWLGPGATPRPAATLHAGTEPDADTPLVAVRGQPLAAYEEPLPSGARVRIGSTRYRHLTRLDQTQVQVAGPYLVVHDGGAFHLVDTATGRRAWTQPIPVVREFFGLMSVTTAVDGRIVVWGSGSAPDRRVVGQVWQVSPDPARPVGLASMLRLPAGEDVTFVDGVFLPEDRSEVWVLEMGGVRAFDVHSGQQVRHVRLKNGVLAMDRRGTRVLTADDYHPRFSGLCRMGLQWFPEYRFHPKTYRDPPTPPRPKRRLPGHLVRSADSTDTDPLTLKVVDTRTGDQVFAVTVPQQRGNYGSHLALSPDGRYLSCETDCCLVVFDVDRGREVLQLDTWEGDNQERHLLVRESWFSDDGRRFTVAGNDIDETQFDLTTGAQLPVSGGTRPARSGLMGSSATEPMVGANGVLQRPHGEPLPPGYAGLVIAYDPTRRLIAAGDATGRLDVWHEDGRLGDTVSARGTRISAVAFSPDGTRLAACGRDRVVRVWKVGNWRECDRFEVPANDNAESLCPDRLVFSPDGRQLLVSRGNVLALWDAGSRSWAWDVPGGDLESAPPPAFTPDGSRVVCPGQDEWIDARTGKAGLDVPGRTLLWGEGKRPWPGRQGDRVGPVLAPDGSFVALIDGTKGLHTVGLAPGSIPRVFAESVGTAWRSGSLRFSPDGRRLVTCDDAGHAHVWEVASGQLAFTLTCPDGAIHDVRFGVDGRTLITANHREVIVWDLAAEPGAVIDPWADLAHEAPNAEQARRALLADPAAAVDLLRRRLRSAAPVDPVAVARLLAGLDADDYRRRERAAVELRAAGGRVLPLLRESKVGSAEGRARLVALVRELEAGPTADELRHVRAVAVLEQIGSPTARAILDEWAAGDPGAVLTAEAGKARARGR